MRFSLPGPLVVVDSAGGRVPVPGPRLRILLAALLLHANMPVPPGELAEIVWDGSPPSGVRGARPPHPCRHQELIPQLLDVTAECPLRERFYAQLMLALASTGRRSEALRTYQQARSVLVDELGIEPAGP